MIDNSRNSSENFDTDDSIEQNISLLYDIPITITIELGGTHLTVEELLKLRVGSVIELNASIGEPVKIFANNALIGYGDIIVVNDFFGIKIISIDSKEEILDKITQ